ncbi:hypothetical protein ACWDSJ_10210 [Nocardia sp. NPDC003482]
MAQPFPSAIPPYPTPPPGWGSGYPAGNARGSSNPLAALALGLAALLMTAHWIWRFTKYEKFYWSDASTVLTVLFAFTAALVLLVGNRSARTKLLAAAATGLILAPDVSFLLTTLDSRLHYATSPWALGGWLAVPITLLALLALILLLTTATPTPPPAPASWPQQPVAPPPNIAWPQPGQAPLAGGYQPPPGQAAPADGYQPGSGQVPSPSGYQPLSGQTPPPGGYQPASGQAPSPGGY